MLRSFSFFCSLYVWVFQQNTRYETPKVEHLSKICGQNCKCHTEQHILLIGFGKVDFLVYQKPFQSIHVFKCIGTNCGLLRLPFVAFSLCYGEHINFMGANQNTPEPKMKTAAKLPQSSKICIHTIYILTQLQSRQKMRRKKTTQQQKNVARKLYYIFYLLSI